MEIREKEERRNKLRAARHEVSWIFMDLCQHDCAPLHIWSRYPFYMLACFNTEWKTLTWLRYTIWIPLYPLGVLAEAVAVIQSIPIFEETQLFSIPLPKVLGTSVSFSYILHVYLVLMFLGLFINFRHLYKQRKRRFRTKKRKTN